MITEKKLSKWIKSAEQMLEENEKILCDGKEYYPGCMRDTARVIGELRRTIRHMNELRIRVSHLRVVS